MSEKQRRHVNYRYFLKLLNLRENGRLDQDYVERLATQLRQSSVKQAVVQAWDGRYDEQGQFDWERTTSLYVPNDHLFAVVRQHPDLFIPCASINPKRRDALEELARCADLGARMVKIHPPTMAVDPGQPRFRAFYRRCAERRILVMAHTGAEHAADTAGLEHCHPAKLALPLEEGCTVIAAHAGSTAFFDKEDFFAEFVALTRRFPNLYCDTSILASMTRWRHLMRVRDTPEAVQRAVHASDFPFPANPLVFWNHLGPRQLFRLLAERNLLERDYRLKLAVGLPAAVFSRGAQLLRLAQGPTPR
jgi:predicted TIM-barrel fold metal-dependent hydrolase